jgi:predicted transcriptional regulator
MHTVRVTIHRVIVEDSNVATQRVTRKEFRKALVDADMSVSAWLRENGVSRTHLYEVLDGNRIPSADLWSKIVATVEEQSRAA